MNGYLLDTNIVTAHLNLVYDMILVTNNTAHFVRFPGLQVEDWLLS